MTLKVLSSQCDLVPAWATKGWLRVLSKEYPSLAFHASINKSFGKVISNVITWFTCKEAHTAIIVEYRDAFPPLRIPWFPLYKPVLNCNDIFTVSFLSVILCMLEKPCLFCQPCVLVWDKWNTLEKAKILIAKCLQLLYVVAALNLFDDLEVAVWIFTIHLFCTGFSFICAETICSLEEWQASNICWFCWVS